MPLAITTKFTERDYPRRPETPQERPWSLDQTVGRFLFWVALITFVLSFIGMRLMLALPGLNVQ